VSHPFLLGVLAGLPFWLGVVVVLLFVREVARNLARDPLADKCRLCFGPLGPVSVGCGDGTGSKYMHPACFEKWIYYRRGARPRAQA
jgi:hypothetical protein